MRTACILEVMDSLRNDPISRCWHGRLLYNGGAVVILGILFFWLSGLLLPGAILATTIYSYVDDQGTPVMTDNFENIPERYRAKVRVTEQAPKGTVDHSVAVDLQHKVAGWTNNIGVGFGKFIPTIYGVTHYQSQVLTVGSIAAVVCLLARFFGGQATRFLSLWCLIMLGLVVPALFFTSQNSPLDRLSGHAGTIQEKQQDRLKQAP
jgi:hypothetical protein